MDMAVKNFIIPQFQAELRFSAKYWENSLLSYHEHHVFDEYMAGYNNCLINPPVVQRMDHMHARFAHYNIAYTPENILDFLILLVPDAMAIVIASYSFIRAGAVEAETAYDVHLQGLFIKNWFVYINSFARPEGYKLN